MAGMGLPGALVGKTLMTGSDSKAKIIWRLLHSCIWYLGCNDSRAGLSELGQHMATPCALGIVTAWWSQGSQFLKWGPGFQKQVPSEQEKSCMAFFCLVFFPFNNLMEIQFTYHTIFPFKKYLSVVSMYSEFFNHHYSQLQNILIAPQKKLHISMFPQP